MKNEQDDCAADVVSSDEEVNCGIDASCQRSQMSRFDGGFGCAVRGTQAHSLQIGLVRAQQAKPMAPSRKTGIIRVVHRWAAL